MKAHAVYFAAPFQIEVRERECPALAPGHALVQTLCSAISPGTEMLVYRGQFPRELAVDETIPALAGAFAYPLQYGYSAVGRVIALGPEVAEEWEGRLVFAFQPHASHFVAPIEALLPLPAGVDSETALFLPGMETAVNFLLDGQPLIGEQVAVFGQGIVGLLTTALLARLPLASLVTLDCFPLRREASLRLGAHASLDPGAPEALTQLRAHLQGERDYAGADLTYELSGAPAALGQAIAATGFGGRVVVGSWYGQKRADLDLGGRFHRSRIRLVSSQVSTLTPELHARWTKARRLNVAWERLRDVQPARFITQRFPLSEAARAYELIDRHPEETIQVVLTAVTSNQ
jgi:2-desacetyl-2-hydroxyethyl bacteriochlorophyllide A dehydrogenase